MANWVSQHTALAAMVLGVVFNLVTDAARAHKSDSTFWRVVDDVLSKAFPDPGGFARFVLGLFSAPPPPPPAKRVDPMLPPSLHERPTTPTLECGTAWPKFWTFAGVTLAGVVLAGCLALRDGLLFTADATRCVLAHTDNGEKLPAAMLECGVETTPEALRFFADLVADHQAAKAARACK